MTGPLLGSNDIRVMASRLAVVRQQAPYLIWLFTKGDEGRS